MLSARRPRQFVLPLFAFSLLMTSQATAQSTATAEKAKAKTKDVLTATTPAPRDHDWWKQRHERFNKGAEKNQWDLVFVGDSITQGWEGGGKEVWKKYYGSRKAGNLGISGDETSHVAWRLKNGNLKGQSPRLAVIMIGTNNLGNVKHSPKAVIAGVTKVVETLHKQSPKTRILLLGVFPRGEKPDDPYRAQIKELNQGISKLADKKVIYYEDIGRAFLEKDGTLSKKIMPDFLHLSPEGYERWAKAIEPKVDELMKMERIGEKDDKKE